MDGKGQPRQAARAGVLAFAGVLCVLALPGASAAFGADRYAEPAGDGDSATCALADPCSIHDAVEGLAVNDGDTVVVLPGVYTVATTVDIRAGITVRGQPGAALPLIEADTGLQQVLRSEHADAVVEDLALRSDFANFSGVLGAFRGRFFQRLQIVAAGTTVGAAGAVVSNGAILRDSIVLASGMSFGQGVISGGTGAVLKNVTAVATGPDSTGALASSSFGRPQTMELRNVIASGTLWDIRAEDMHVDADPIEIEVAYSNFDAATATGTDAQVHVGAGNQSEEPLFDNAATGDYHQLAGSPTINAGSPDALIGPFDVDRQPRTMGPAIDIGGDEFSESPPPPPPPPPPAEPTEPANAFEFGKLKRNKKKGTALLTVILPGPGEVGLGGKGIAGIAIGSAAAASLGEGGGEVRLKVKPAKGKQGKRVRKRLRTKGKAKVRAKVTYVPSGGAANTRAKKVKLVRR